jgi:hypothetical protein
MVAAHHCRFFAARAVDRADGLNLGIYGTIGNTTKMVQLAIRDIILYIGAANIIERFKEDN